MIFCADVCVHDSIRNNGSVKIECPNECKLAKDIKEPVGAREDLHNYYI